MPITPRWTTFWPTLLTLLTALVLTPTAGRANTPTHPLAGEPPPAIERVILEAARDLGLDPALLMAVAATESGFDPETVSRSGAIGVMQLMPATAQDMGVTDPYDIAQNVRGGARYLRLMLDRFPTLHLALSAYNAGPGRVERSQGDLNIPETRRYVEKVLTHYRRFRFRNLQAARPMIRYRDAQGRLVITNQPGAEAGRPAADAEVAAASEESAPLRLSAIEPEPPRISRSHGIPLRPPGLRLASESARPESSNPAVVRPSAPRDGIPLVRAAENRRPARVLRLDRHDGGLRIESRSERRGLRLDSSPN